MEQTSQGKYITEETAKALAEHQKRIEENAKAERELAAKMAKAKK